MLSCQEKPTFLLEVRQEVISPHPWSAETKAVLLSPCVAALIGVWNFEDLCVCLPLPRRRARSRPDGERRGPIFVWFNMNSWFRRLLNESLDSLLLTRPAPAPLHATGDL